MGTGTFVNERPLNRPRFTGGFDMPLLVALAILIVFGLVMLFSASYDFSGKVYGDPMYMFNRQLMWLGVGMVIFTILAFSDYHYWRKLVVPAMVVSVILLIAVLFVEGEGPKRGLFNGSVQPSELAKLVSVLYLGVWLNAKKQDLQDVSFGLIPLGVILGFVGGLIGLEPDFSAAVTILILGGLLFFLAGGDIKQISILLVVAIIAAVLVSVFTATGRDRMIPFIAGLKNPLDSSDHVRASLGAIANGGWFGTGLGLSRSKYLQLPLPPRDSIFAVIAEELGLVGSIALIALYGFIFWRGFVVARRAPDMLGTLLASGLVTWIAFEALSNIAVMVGLMPFTGNSLPFVSSGGSNLVIMLSAFGMVSNISRQTGEGTITDEEWRSYSAVANLRWGDGRRSVSRARRTQRADQSKPRL
ncbi:putative peptidoglycan glycosyltransferase FtsW [Candidatus Villigracilis saccharophilus]|uniref:FtsW/RodA/SpoVE family cell cycle protein n=1 Tax=Candidatus Villigracilis saccharophilus TaxID=3140684 RepID=UPI003135E297|nr:cell division protein FtsW [Anaerolineales bacterium]